ncbi:WD40 repeat domain-containing protein [Brachybacterium huguangmaarense]
MADRIPRRRWLVGAAAIPGALMATGCDLRLPGLPGRGDRGRCLGPDEEIPESELETHPDGMIVDPAPPDTEHRFGPGTPALSPDGSMLAGCETDDLAQLGVAETAGVILWDTATGAVVRRITPPARGTIAWHPDGTRLAIGDGRIIAIVDLEGNVERILPGHRLPDSDIASIRALAYSPDGSRLASSATDGTVRLWATGEDDCGTVHVLEPGPRNGSAIAYSPDGTVLAIGGASSSSADDPGNPPELWDPASGRRRKVLRDVGGEVFDLGFAQDGALLVVADGPPSLREIAPDGTVREGPATASTWFSTLAVGARRRVALLSGQDELVVWDRTTGEELRSTAPDGMRTLRWSPDESRLYGLSPSQGAMAWDGKEWQAFDLP